MPAGSDPRNRESQTTIVVKLVCTRLSVTNLFCPRARIRDLNGVNAIAIIAKRDGVLAVVSFSLVIRRYAL